MRSFQLVAITALQLISMAAMAQVSIHSGTGTDPDASSMLDVQSTATGVLVPRMTQAQRNAIASPAHSLMIYQTDNTPGYYYNSGTPGSPEWQRLFAGTGSPVTGTGTTDYLARWTSATALGIGAVRDNGTRVGVGAAPHGTYMLQVGGDVLLTSGSVRTTGSTGWVNETHGGGWHMTDGTWIRSSGNKSIYQNTGTMRTDGTLQVGGSGSTFNVANNGNLAYRTNVLFANTDGNVGIGTASPVYKLESNGEAGFNAIHKIGPVSNNPERGMWNPIYTAIAASRPLYADEEFASGTNSVVVYNNSGGTGVQHFWEDGDGSQPNASGKWIRIVNNGNATSPGLGGFLLLISSRRNATFVQRFRARLPVGYNLVIAQNSQGSNSTSYWLTPTAGTGKWEEYIRISHCGNTGTFSSGGHVYVTGSPAVFTWHLASCNVYEVGSSGTGSGINILNQTTANQAAGFRITGDGLFNGGNVGIGNTAPLSKLQVNFTSSGGFTGQTAYAGIHLKQDAGNDGYIGITTTATSSGTQGGILFQGSGGYGTKIRFMTTDSYAAGMQERMVLDHTGNLGLGYPTPTYKLHVNGTIRTNAINETSDARLKTDVTALSDALAKVIAMRGVNYRWRIDEFPDMVLDSTMQFGLIAQELEQVVPELVKTDSEGWKSIEYSHIVPLLIEGMKEQQDIINRHQATMDIQKRELDELRSMVIGIMNGEMPAVKASLND